MENQIQGRGNEISWSQFSGIPLNCGILSEGKFLTMAKNLDNIAQVRHDYTVSKLSLIRDIFRVVPISIVMFSI